MENKSLHKKIKMSKQLVYITTDDTEFTGTNAAESANRHQNQLDLKARQELIKKDLWIALGLPEKAYGTGILDDWYEIANEKDVEEHFENDYTDGEHPPITKKAMLKAADILHYLCDNVYDDIFDGSADDFDEFFNDIVVPMIKHISTMDKIMRVLRKHLKDINS